MKKISFLVVSIFLAITLISCYPRYTIIPLPDIDNPIDTDEPTPEPEGPTTFSPQTVQELKKAISDSKDGDTIDADVNISQEEFAEFPITLDKKLTMKGEYLIADDLNSELMLMKTVSRNGEKAVGLSLFDIKDEVSLVDLTVKVAESAVAMIDQIVSLDSSNAILKTDNFKVQIIDDETSTPIDNPQNTVIAIAVGESVPAENIILDAESDAKIYVDENNTAIDTIFENIDKINPDTEIVVSKLPETEIKLGTELSDGIIYYDRGAEYGKYNYNEATKTLTRIDYAVDDGSKDSTAWRFLIVAKENLIDFSEEITWGEFRPLSTQRPGWYETSYEIGSGLNNTSIMLGYYGTESEYIWPRVKEEQDTTGEQWFVPSALELYELYKVKDELTNITFPDFTYTNEYWTSTRCMEPLTDTNFAVLNEVYGCVVDFHDKDLTEEEVRQDGMSANSNRFVRLIKRY